MDGRKERQIYGWMERKMDKERRKEIWMKGKKEREMEVK